MQAGIEISIIDFLKDFSEFVLEKGRVRRHRFRTDVYDALVEAAEAKRKCLIRYKKKKHRGGGTFEYYVAPYSIMWRGDIEMLYAYDFMTGHIKSFHLDGVTGVEITERRFRPKWEISVA
jgi:predicted DNA-binding transcriptional regulator YafY